MHGPDYILNIDALPKAADAIGGPHGVDDPPANARDWIAVKWKCCSVYTRIYKHKEGNRYEGRCPKCMKKVSAQVGPGGTNRRFFEAE